MTTFVTVGANRVYAHVDGEFTYQSWIDALKLAVRSSATIRC